MSNPLKSLIRLLKDGSVRQLELTAAPPFVKLVFDKTEFEAMLRGKEQISAAVADNFVARRVYWVDIKKESEAWVDDSLTQAEAELSQLSKRLSESADETVVALAKFCRAWATETKLVHKTWRDELKRITDEKNADPGGYDSSNSDRADAMHETLVSLRQRIYPMVSVLVAFLDEDDPAKTTAQNLLDAGLNLVPKAVVQRGCVPEIDEASV